jgi:hypothetical protein
VPLDSVDAAQLIVMELPEAEPEGSLPAPMVAAAPAPLPEATADHVALARGLTMIMRVVATEIPTN